MIYKTCVTMDNTINPDGSLMEDCRLRADKSISLYRQDFCDTLTMPGRYDIRDFEKVPITHSEALKRYAMQNGVPEEDIIKEESGRTMTDSVGCLFFLKKKVLIPRNWENLIVVSSDYHYPRLQDIWDFIFGGDFYVHYIAVDTKKSDDEVARKMKTEEEDKRRKFGEFWRGISPGDDDAIQDKLFSEHPYYKGMEVV